SEREGGGGKIFRIGNAFRDEAVFRARLIEARFEQRVVDERKARRRLALDDIGIEAVEGADARIAHLAALRRLRVHIVEMLEAGCVFELAEKRDAVPLGITRLRGARSEGGKREAGREQRQTCLDEPHVSSRVFPAKDRPSLWLFFAASASRERGGARQP